MARYKYSDRTQMEMKVIDYTSQLVPGTLEHTIDFLLEEKIDLGRFDEQFQNDKTGASAYPPKIILKVILFAYAKGILSCRKIEKSCEENVVFMALAGGHVPHFTYIADFIHRFEEEIKKVFMEVLLICWELDLIGGEFLAIDGCKLSANTAKEWSGTFSDLEKKENKLRKTLKYILEENSKKEKPLSKADIQKRVLKIENKVRRVREFLENNEPRLGPRGKEIQSNITDNESARLKSSHGWVQGYNGMAMVDSKSQVVIHAEVFGGNNEGMFFQEFMENTKKTIESHKISRILRQSKLIADTGFFSEDNLKYLADEKIDAYIPDQYYRKRDPRFMDKARHNTGKRKGYFSAQEFEYNETLDEFTCPNGSKLPFKRKHKLGNTQGSKYEANPHDCQTCSLKHRCLKSDNTRFRTVYITQPKYGRDYVKEMMNKIDTSIGRDIYSKRMGIVEPVYANICYAKGMNRFHYRGKRKVNIQWLLFCMVNNIGKIANVMRN